jgi:hypothetical protein
MAKKRTSPLSLRRLLTHPGVMVYGLPALMALLTAGTISQRYIGLYESERLFFSSFILWIGLIPLPGAYTLLSVLSISLIAKLLFESPWSPQKSGIIITHMGAILLLLGGLLTAFTTEEGYIMLKPGETSARVSDYHLRELAIVKNGETVHSVPLQQLRAELKIAAESVPFTVRITAVCRNCVPTAPEKSSKPFHGIAKELTLAAAPLAAEDEENQAGAVLEISGAESADGIHIAYEPTRKQPEFTLGKDTYRIEMRHIARTLPFSVRLDEFRKANYPGTGIARSYESAITVSGDGIAWPFTVKMNHPLRYDGYTLYQSSFVTTDDGEFSVLAVVKNHGRVFPYVASLVMCIGIVTHLVMRRRTKK